MYPSNSPLDLPYLRPCNKKSHNETLVKSHAKFSNETDINPFLKVLNCDLVPDVFDNKSALIFCMRVAFSLLSASVPQVVAIVPNVPILLPMTVAETSNPAEIRAPKEYYPVLSIILDKFLILVFT